MEMGKMGATELKESPSKASKIILRYINPYLDVGQVIAQPAVTLDELKEMAKQIDKKETWIKSDQRLIFALEGVMRADEVIEKLNVIVRNPSVSVFA